MNDGDRLVNVFLKVGCTSADKLTGASFDYLFEDNDVKAFLRSFCKSVETGELVTLNDAQLDTLNELGKAGKNVDDDILLETIVTAEQRRCHGNVVSSSSELERFEDDIALLKSRRCDLIWKRDVLSEERKRLERDAMSLKKLLVAAEKCVHDRSRTCKRQREEMRLKALELGEFLEKIFESKAEEEYCTRNASQPDVEGYVVAERNVLARIEGYAARNLRDEGKRSSLIDWQRNYCDLERCLNESERFLLQTKAAEKGRKKCIDADLFAIEDPTPGIALLRRKSKSLLETIRDEPTAFSMGTRLSNDVAHLVGNEALDGILAANRRLKSQRQRQLSSVVRKVEETSLLQGSRLALVEETVGREYSRKERFERLVDDVRDRLSCDLSSFGRGEHALKEMQNNVGKEQSDERAIGFLGDAARRQELRTVASVCDRSGPVAQTDELVSLSALGCDVRNSLETLSKKVRSLEASVTDIARLRNNNFPKIRS